MRLITFLFAAVTLCSLSAADEKPNLVVIFTDDQGYGDVNCFNPNWVVTPKIDQMAKEGARLTSFYVAAPVCTPSRAALMTGCYPRRVDMETGSSIKVELKNVPAGKKFPVCLAGDGKGLNPDEITIAEVAQSAGYKTGMFGKWHLGDQPEFLPTRQGFEEFFGLPYSHDIAPSHKNQKAFKFPALPVLEGEKVIEIDPDPAYLTRRVTERAVDFIKRNKDENFFLYVAHPLPHGPLAASKESRAEFAKIDTQKPKAKGKKGRSAKHSLLRNTIFEIDWSVGEILTTLKEQGIDDNTIVLFTSDNGAAAGTSKPLRGKKTQTLEGGMRVPTVIRWPAKIKPGSDNDTVMTTMDILPTFAKLIGAELNKDRPIDGKDILPVLLEGAETPHEYFFYSYWESLDGVRWKNWKYLNFKGKEGLYDLSKDTTESKNLMAQHPEIVTQLKAAMADFLKDMEENKRPAGSVENPKPLTLAE